MSKVHVKNGFEYKCSRSNYNGSWMISWHYRPVGEPIFLTYSCNDKFKTLKVDVEKHLSAPIEAESEYKNRISRACDIEYAEARLIEARQRFDKVNSPDFDLRGNNPNRERNARRDADSGLRSAESAVEIAKEYRKILNLAS
ncbi:hypothetical protein ACVFI8_16635 [Agarivorans sp. MS3-6]